jgi:eukaryotic-like serine/threonine-protein kinase
MARGERETLPVRWGGYLLVKRLAVGGMAEVYLAIDEPPLGGRRWVVIKRVREDYIDEPEYAQFFLTEGQISLKVHHPNLPVAHRFALVDERAFLVLEYIHGHSLIQLLRAAITARRGLSVPSTIAIGLGAARALAHLHELADLDGAPLHVVHRDVSPHNLIIGDGGIVKLIDLGVARAALQTHHTETGVVKGKYAYMAPEQLRATAHLDARADLFSLGVVIWELLVGRALFQGTSDLDTCDRVRSAPIASPESVRADLPGALAQVVMTALERDPDRRWASATTLAAALEAAATRSGVWPSEAGLALETIALLGPAPRPMLDRGVLVWRDAAPATPRVFGTADGTVMEQTPAPLPPPPRAPSDDSEIALAAGLGDDLGLDDLEDHEHAGGDEDDDGAPEHVDDEPTDSVDVPPDAPPLEPTRRDPALSYYLHVGAVKPLDGPDKK